MEAKVSKQTFIFFVSNLFQILSFVTLCCYPDSMNKAYAAVPFVEMILSIIFLGILTMELDQKFQVLKWIVSLYLNTKTRSLTCLGKI